FSENSTHYFIHVEYTHSMHEIAARFTPVINVTADKPVGATVNSMHLAWSQTTDPGEYDCYEIYQSTLPGAVGVLIYTETDYTVTTCTVTNLSPGVTYYFTVRTVYEDGFYADSNLVFEKTIVGAVLFEDPDTGTKVNIKYTGTGSLSIVNVSQPGTIPAKMQSIGVFIEITTPPSISTEWAYIEIPYDSNALPAGVKEAGLRMYYWTGIEWKKCDNTGVDTDNNVVWANVTHFTIFAPMAEKTAAPVSLLPYIIIFAITIVLIGAGLGFKMMRKEKPVTVKCQKCGETIDITGLEKPVEVVCPKCGAKETLEEGKG
ncbi:MAG: fibronectin type III domain-containing protein, partial [Thermoplasmatales archaeon]|nr:fibronectin type III domain-containing protein [Thermoplasmatales archaeon]